MSYIPSKLSLTNASNTFSIEQNPNDNGTTLVLPSELAVNNPSSNSVGIKLYTYSGSHPAYLKLVSGEQEVKMDGTNGTATINAVGALNFISANNNNFTVAGTSDIATATYTLNTVGSGLASLSSTAATIDERLTDLENANTAQVTAINALIAAVNSGFVLTISTV